MVSGRSACFAGVLLLCGAACGGRSPVEVAPPFDASTASAAEQCNGLDDDGDGKLDEDFRDAQGNYLSDAHCGSCGHACDTPIANAVSAGCELLAGAPTCVARRCAAGFGRTHSGGCAALDDHLCMPCRDDGDCGALLSARCAPIGDQQRCTRGCEQGCPGDYTCVGGDHCVPVGRSCECSADTPDFALACELRTALGSCAGQARCRGGVLSMCTAADERCDGADDDCDGKIDEGFADAIGAYSLDAANCGACGVDCNRDVDAGVTLACGGDPFEPSCVTFCPDTLDGVQLGDHLDANRNLADGCECVVRSLGDSSGAPAAEGQLDANCDGADGNVLSSYYVSVGGDDNGPGSPTHPLRSIGVAIARAAASIGGSQPRPDVYVASGIYTESGGAARRRARARRLPQRFSRAQSQRLPVVVAAPADTPRAGRRRARRHARGQHAHADRGRELSRARRGAERASPRWAVLLTRAGPAARLHAAERALGASGRGSRRRRGRGRRRAELGARRRRAAACRDRRQRARVCDGRRQPRARRRRRSQRVRRARRLGRQRRQHGLPLAIRPRSVRRRGPRGLRREPRHGGAGRHRSHRAAGRPRTCPGTCCGLSDFEVPSVFVQATPGGAGGNGPRGAAGAACTDPVGVVSARSTCGSGATARERQRRCAGGGGGGGGAAAASDEFDQRLCEFADGLGGGGGGGGAGGCGGGGGAAGLSGGPAVGILIHANSALALPVLDGVEVITQDGGSGGDGGAGGDGGLGGSGAFGGSVPEALRSTPTLAGPMSGERGGVGGDGGAGGGGGGGCGGSSIGLWLTGLGNHPALRARFQSGNVYVLGAGGAAGRGGGGAVPSAAGAAGNSADVLVQ